MSASTYRGLINNLCKIGRKGETTHHETCFKIIRSDAHQGMDFTEEVEVEWCHSVVVGDAREEVHEDKLPVSFATITRLLVLQRLGLCSAFDNDDRRCSSTRDSWKVEIVSDPPRAKYRLWSQARR